MHRLTPLILLLATAIALTAAACGDDDDNGDLAASLTPSPEATAPSEDGQSIGDFEDLSDFRTFAFAVEVAIAEADVQFFLDRALFDDVECGVEFPAPPASCEGQPEGATVPGIVVGVFQSEGFALDEAAYEQFITEYLTAYDESAPPDAYGGPAPRLYAYGGFGSSIPEVPPEGSVETVHAIATRIAPSGCPDDCPETVPGEGRTALYIGANFIDEDWRISHLHVGSVGYVDPFSPEASEVGADELFEFWHRWPEP